MSLFLLTILYQALHNMQTFKGLVLSLENYVNEIRAII